MKMLQTLSMANQRRICASLYLGVCAAALGRSGALLTLGQYMPLSLACHGRDYMLHAAGSTALAILIQPLIKIACESQRQTVSWPVIGTINPPTEREAEGCPEEGMKGDPWRANDRSCGSTISASPSFKTFTSTQRPTAELRWSALHCILTIHTSSATLTLSDPHGHTHSLFQNPVSFLCRQHLWASKAVPKMPDFGRPLFHASSQRGQSQNALPTEAQWKKENADNIVY